MKAKPATTAAWDACLPEMNLDALQPVFPPSGDADKARQLSEDRKLVRRSDKAIVLDARRLANCITFLGRLPAKNESFHCITEKNFAMCHVVPATLKLAAPATLKYLGISTLSFSQANMVDLLTMLDRGQIGTIDMAYSVYFKSNEKENCTRLAHELTAQNCRVFSGLVHSKILLLELSDGRQFSVESSANLRSCASIENLSMFSDPTLFAFHREWLDSLFTEAKK